MSDHRLTVLILALFMLVGLVTGGPIQSGPVKELHSFGEYIVEVDGTHAKDFRLFRSNEPPAFLVIGPGFNDAALLLPVESRVDRLGIDFVQHTEDGRVLLAAGYTTDRLGSFTVADSVNFDFEGHKVRLKQKPYLLKHQTSSDLVSYDPTYGWRAGEYKPDQSLVAKIKASAKQAEVTVYFGSWCQFCQRYVPHLLRMEQELEGSQVRFSYFGLPRDFGLEPETTRKNIQRVPTAIVKIGGREVGRLVGKECQQPEVKLAAILGR